MEERYRKIEDQKPWLVCVSRDQDFAEGRGLEPNVTMTEMGGAFSKLV